MSLISIFSPFAEKYPQIKKLFGVDPWFKWKVVGLVLLQFLMLFVVRDCSWPITIALAYCFGGVINHALMLGERLRIGHYTHYSVL